jgi:hypothetical protein
MAYRSGIRQNAIPNPAPFTLYSQTTSNVVSGTRNNLAITLPAGTYSCTLSFQFGVSGVGSVTVANINVGLSSSAVTATAIAPLPLSATTSIDLIGGQGFLQGSGFSDFKTTVISLSAPTTIYLFNVVQFTPTTTPVVSMTQNLTIVELIG